MVSKTRKTTKSSKVKSLSVPELRRSFEHIDRFVDTKVMRMSEKDGVTAFRNEWKKTFGQISEKAARDYLHYIRSTATKQKGGAVTVLNPASLGYDMRAGEGGPSVPPYVAGGIAPPMDSQIGPSRGAEFPLPAAGLGDNQWVAQKGGKRRTRKGRKQNGGALPSFGTSLAEFVSRPFGMSAPPTPSQDAQMLMKGYNNFSSPRPEVNDLSFTQGRSVFNATISNASRMF